jgi:ribosome recycling factor
LLFQINLFMSPLLIKHQEEFAAAIEHLKIELNSIRGNRASPSLVEDIKITAYGSEMRLKELASLSLPEPRIIVVQPWDKTVLKDIERGLNLADLNVGIQNDGTVLRLSFPPLTEETRQAIIKVLGQKLEAGRIQLRQIREKIREEIVKQEQAKEITEDDRYKAQEDLDELISKWQAQVKELGDKKEQEILTV